MSILACSMKIMYAKINNYLWWIQLEHTFMYVHTFMHTRVFMSIKNYLHQTHITHCINHTYIIQSHIIF